MNSKLILSFIIIVCLFPLVTFSQSTDNLRFGAQVSPTISWISSDHAKVLGGGPDLGLKVGAIGEFGFAENYFFTVGLGFGLAQAGKIQFAEGGDVLPNSLLSTEVPEAIRHNFPVDTKVDYRLNYLEIPIGLKLRTREYGYTRYFAEIPIITLSAVTSAKGNIDAANLDVNKENIRKDVKALNAQWGLGGGMEYYFSESNAFTIGVYYHQGFFDITSKRPTNDGKEINHTIALKVGILF
ncbi:MAG: PorT family protein [Bacteroidetes bacterium]|jgi:hypothetical protein|nr:PorT family protein [Bacteroidota bacterium]